MVHNTLDNYYKTNFSLMYQFKLPLDVEEILPFERDIYVAMIKDHQEQLKVERQRQQAIAQAQANAARSRF